MSELDSGDSDICQNLTHFFKNNLVTNLIIHTTVKASSLEC